MYRPPLSSLAPYMYEAWYDTIDYAYAYQWFRSHTPVVGGGCSTVRKGNLIGRNLDWTYSESAEFIVHTDGVVGVANAIPGLTDAFVKSGADDEIYKIVPFMLSDGMNKHGLMVSTLVVPTDKGDNSVVRPLGASSHMMCTLMLPRYMLDHFRTALGAMTYFKDSITLYHPKTLQDQHYDQHFIIADAVHTLCMEFVDGRYDVTNINHKPFVTNFHLTGVEFNEDGSVNTPASGKASDNKITPNGSGLERYNLINERIKHPLFFMLPNDADTLPKLMQDLAYTRAYQSSPNPASPRWDTEFVGTGLTVDSPTSAFDYIQIEAATIYTNRSRILGDTWQTVHSAVYDVQEKKLRIYAQENYDTHWEVSVMADQTHVQHLRGDTAKNDAFTGSAGEFTVNTTSHSIRVHDGVMEGGYGTVNATHMAQLPDGGVAPKDLPVGAHVIVGDGKLGSSKLYRVNAQRGFTDVTPDGAAIATLTNPGIVMPGRALSVTGTGVLNAELATSGAVGVVRPGDGLEVDSNGVLNVVGMGDAKFAKQDMTFYVRKTGSDDNDGLTVDTAFLTVKRAIREFNSYFFLDKFCTVDIGAGVFDETDLSVVSSNSHSERGVNIVGVGKQGTVIRCSVSLNQHGLSVAGSVVGLVGMTIECVSPFSVVGSFSNGLTSFTNVKCVSSSTPYYVVDAYGAGKFVIGGGCEFVAGSSTINSILIARERSSIVISGSCSFSGKVYMGCVESSENSVIVRYGSCTGSVTGPRYKATLNGVINTSGAGASAFPGSSTGSTSLGGQYS